MKRFWKDVSVVEADGGWRIALDGRTIKTQKGAAQVLPSRTLADLLAREWSAQGDEIDPAAFPMRDMADYAIEVVAQSRTDTSDQLVRYAETDTLCYRADPDEPLWKRQQAVWEPVLQAFEARESVRMERVSGIVHRAQPEATLAALRHRIEAIDPFTLAALEVMTSLAASLCIGLSALADDADPEALWDAAELEERWQVEQWGSDTLAEERRAKRRADFLRAALFARTARTG